MALPIPAGRQRVDRHHLVASRHQRGNQQPTIQLDADHDLGRLAGVASDQPMQLGNPGHPIGTRRRPSTAPAWSSTHTSWWASAQPTPTKITRPPLLHHIGEPRRPAATYWSSALRHAIPPAVSLLTDQQGTL
jgi:hypothetical protein